MPEYFFHVCLELFSNPQQPKSDSANPVDLTHAFKSLRPFLRSPRPQHGRDAKFDTQRADSRTKIRPASRTFLERIVTEQFQASAPSDHRIDHIELECIDMESSSSGQEQRKENPQESKIDKGLGTAISGAQTKGRYVAVKQDFTGDEWGIVHLYRDASETPGLYKENPSQLAQLRDANDSTPVPKSRPMTPLPPARDEDCTTLCILAVPSYLTPADFLAFVGPETREQVSHFRMIRTSRQNRYMVLMKFLNGKKARNWQAEWNGRVFNSMEPETVHVVFIKSVEVAQPSTSGPNGLGHAADSDGNGTSTFPRITNDPFATSPVPPTSKPLAPRTPSLVELPTCPVCLERMDETTGLLTILCQHVFHCTCLEKWSGGGCPVCRYTHDDFSTKLGGSSHKYKSKSKIDGSSDEYEVHDEPLECEVCHVDTSLWQCLICGKVGCGRYEGKHAYAHFEDTGHTFSMDLETKRVWDYAGDVYVHRIIQDAVKSGEKLVELPGRRRETTALEMDEDVEVVKMENIAVEYTHLLTSQLESQRVYFEEIVERAADKASEANKKADRAIEQFESMQAQFLKLSFDRDQLLDKEIPVLKSERNRLEKRATKFEDMAKSVNSRYLEEKSLASSLMERIKHLEETRLKDLEKKIQELEEDNATKDLLMDGLRDEHRDAMMQISAQEKLREMVANGELEPEDLVGATIEAGPTPVIKKGRRAAKKDVAAPGPSGGSASKEEADALARHLKQKLGLDGGQMEMGPGWDGDKAAQLMEELRVKMLEQGLLKERSKENLDAIDDGDDDNDDGGPSAQIPSKAPTKKKKKGKARK